MGPSTKGSKKEEQKEESEDEPRVGPFSGKRGTQGEPYHHLAQEI